MIMFNLSNYFKMIQMLKAAMMIIFFIFTVYLISWTPLLSTTKTSASVNSDESDDLLQQSFDISELKSLKKLNKELQWNLTKINRKMSNIRAAAIIERLQTNSQDIVSFFVYKVN